MFKKLFGGSDKPQKEAPKPQQPAQQQPANQAASYQMEFERLQYQIKLQEDNFEKKIDKYTERIDTLRGTVKELVKLGKKKQATFKLQEVQQLEQYINRAENQKQVFLKVRMQLEHGLENMNSTEVLSKAAQVLKATTDFDKLEETLGELQEMDQDQKQIDQMFEQQAQLGINTDGIEDELAAIEAELKQEEANKLNTQINNIPVANVNVQQQQQPIVQVQQQPAQKQKQDDAFSNALLDQLAL
ncbi:hypothetical protein ABPG72_005530 [Tetrahymena utriculariae]